MTHESAKLWNNSNHGTAEAKRQQRMHEEAARARRSREENRFDRLCADHGIPIPEHGYLFATWTGGRPGCLHVRGGFQCSQCGATRPSWKFDYVFEGWLAVGTLCAEARNEAVLLGYAVLEFHPDRLADGSALKVIRRVLGSSAGQP